MAEHDDLQKPQPNWIERIAIVAACATIAVVFRGDLSRFIGNTGEAVRTELRENMPIASEIERARELAAGLVPDLRRNHEVIVREQVEIDELRVDIEQRRERLKRQRDQLIALRGQLKPSTNLSDDTVARHSTSEMRQELQHRFATLQSELATVGAKAETLKYREESLAKAQAVQNEMLRKKRELEAQVAQLDARVKLIEREGIDLHITVDRDHVARCEEQLKYLKKRLSIAERISKFSVQEVSGAQANDTGFADESIEIEIDQFLAHEKG